jgi:MFS family permease
MSSPDLAKPASPGRTTKPQSGRSSLAELSGRALFFLLILDLSYFINAMDRQVFAVLLPDIKATYGLTGGEAGIIATIFTLGMGLAGIPAGYLADRFGRKKIVLISLLMFSISCALQATAVGAADMALWRILSGVGEGMQVAALFAAVGAYFNRHRGFALGSISAAFGLGGFTGPLLGGAILSATGDWRSPLVIFGAVGIVILLLVLVLVPKSVTEIGRNEKAESISQSSSHGQRFLNRRIVCCLIVASAGGFSIYGYLGLYPTYLRESLGFTPTEAGLAASMFGIGALGALIGGILADRIDQRLLNVVGLLAIMILGTAIFAFSSPLPVQMVFSALLGAAFSGVLITNTSALLQRSVHANYLGRVSGLLIAAMYIPASASGYFVTFMQGNFGWQTAGIVQLTVIPIVALIAMGVMGKTSSPNLKVTSHV